MPKKQGKQDGDEGTKSSETPSVVSKEEYLELLDDRPFKFTPEQVNFREALDYEPPCCSCVHWHYAPMRNTAVCEVMRPPQEHVPSHWTCVFHTTDMEHYPLLEEAEN